MRVTLQNLPLFSPTNGCQFYRPISSVWIRAQYRPFEHRPVLGTGPGSVLQPCSPVLTGLHVHGKPAEQRPTSQKHGTRPTPITIPVFPNAISTAYNYHSCKYTLKIRARHSTKTHRARVDLEVLRGGAGLFAWKEWTQTSPALHNRRVH